jgi:hypothetical protein
MSDTYFKFTDTTLRKVEKYTRRCCGMKVTDKTVRLPSETPPLAVFTTNEDMELEREG